MTDPSAMTPAEQARVAAVIDSYRPRRMRRPDGRELLMSGDLIPSRLAAGYVLTDTEEGE